MGKERVRERASQLVVERTKVKKDKKKIALPCNCQQKCLKRKCYLNLVWSVDTVKKLFTKKGEYWTRSGASTGFRFCSDIPFGMAGVRGWGRLQQERAGLSHRRTLRLCDPTRLATHTNACFVSGLALFHMKRLTSSKGIHDAADANRSHFQGVEESTSSCGWTWLKGDMWFLLLCHTAGTEARKPPNNYMHCVKQP